MTPEIRKLKSEKQEIELRISAFYQRVDECSRVDVQQASRQVRHAGEEEGEEPSGIQVHSPLGKICPPPLCCIATISNVPLRACREDCSRGRSRLRKRTMELTNRWRNDKLNMFFYLWLPHGGEDCVPVSGQPLVHCAQHVGHALLTVWVHAGVVLGGRGKDTIRATAAAAATTV